MLAAPDPNTRIAGQIVGAVLGPLAVADLDTLLNKARTRELCRRIGVPVPDGRQGPGPVIARTAAVLLTRTGRVVVKEPTGYAGSGVTTGILPR